MPDIDQFLPHNFMKNPLPVIIDTDPGIDDSLAIFFAILEKISLKGITTVYGNATVENTTQNALMLLELFKKGGVPVFQGADAPLSKPARLAECHGATGLGKFAIALPAEAKSQGNAVSFLRSTLEKDKCTLLCLGPLTNIAALIQSAPSLIGTIESIVLLGGGFSGPGNVSPYAEFNIYNDPEALEIVLKSSVPKVIIPLEVCRKVTINKEELDGALADSPLRESIHAIADIFIEYYEQNAMYGGFSGGVMYDLLIIGYYLYPELFTVTPSCVSVDTSDGDMRGKTSMSAGPINALVARDVDALVLKERFLVGIREWNMKDFK
jgi:inosine-uridine nucleoside N-ribohydrolase